MCANLPLLLWKFIKGGEINNKSKHNCHGIEKYREEIQTLLYEIGNST